jgi:hypothetical protein
MSHRLFPHRKSQAWDCQWRSALQLEASIQVIFQVGEFLPGLVQFLKSRLLNSKTLDKLGKTIQKVFSYQDSIKVIFLSLAPL